MSEHGLDPEELRGMLQAAVATRATSPRAFGEIQLRYRQRRRNRRITAATLAALVLAGGGYAAAALVPQGAPSSLQVGNGSAAHPQPSSVTTPPPSPSPAGQAGAAAPTGFRPQSASFVSALVGWAVGAARCGARACTELMGTRDGGRTWSFVSEPPFPVQAPGQVTPGDAVSALRFANGETGWAFGPALWVTGDGGRTWRRDTTFGSAVDQAVDQVGPLETAGGMAYAVVHTGEGNGCTELEATPVGTGHWAKVAGVGGCGAGLGDASLTLYGSSGWLLLENAGWSYYRLTRGEWQRAPFPCAGPGSVGYASSAAVAAASPTLVAIGCTGSGAAGSAAKSIYLSSDGGVHFSLISSGPSAGGPVLLAMNASRILVGTWSGASWIDGVPTTGGTLRSLLRLSDGGAGWHDLGLTTPTQGFVIEGSLATGTAMYMTRDGGETWTPVKF